MSYNFKDAKLTWYNQDMQQTSILTGIFLTEVTVTYTSITLDTKQDQTATIKGLRTISGSGSVPNINPGDMVLVQPQAALGNGLSFSALVTAANTLTITMQNNAATQTPGALSFNVLVFKFGQLDGLSS